MSSELIAIANSWQLWVLCGILVVIVVIQAFMFIRQSKKEAIAIGFDSKRLNKAVGNGMVTAIGPGLAGIVVMISMMAVMGGPITWQRLSIIGAAQTELSVAKIGADAMGVTFGGPDFGMSALTLGFLLMGINGCGWLLMTTLCTGSMETVRTKLSGGNPAWLGLLSAGATSALFSHFSAQQIIKGAGPAAACISGFAVQFLIDRLIAPKAPWIKGYAITFALIIGMIVGYIVQPV